MMLIRLYEKYIFFTIGSLFLLGAAFWYLLRSDNMNALGSLFTSVPFYIMHWSHLKSIKRNKALEGLNK